MRDLMKKKNQKINKLDNRNQNKIQSQSYQRKNKS